MAACLLSKRSNTLTAGMYELSAGTSCRMMKSESAAALAVSSAVEKMVFGRLSDGVYASSGTMASATASFTSSTFTSSASSFAFGLRPRFLGAGASSAAASGTLASSTFTTSVSSFALVLRPRFFGSAATSATGASATGAVVSIAFSSSDRAANMDSSLVTFMVLSIFLALS